MGRRVRSIAFNVSVYVSLYVSVCSYILKTTKVKTSRHFLYAIGGRLLSSVDSNAISYVLPVLWITSFSRNNETYADKWYNLHRDCSSAPVRNDAALSIYVIVHLSLFQSVCIAHGGRNHRLRHLYKIFSRLLTSKHNSRSVWIRLLALADLPPTNMAARSRPVKWRHFWSQQPQSWRRPCLLGIVRRPLWTKPTSLPTIALLPDEEIDTQ